MNRTAYLTAIVLRNEAEDACRADHAAYEHYQRVADQAAAVGNHLDATRYRDLAREARYSAQSWATLTNFLALSILLRDGSEALLSGQVTS